jgi:hypothetical protein
MQNGPDMKKTIYLLFLFSACALAAHAQRWSYDTLSEKKVDMNVAVSGNKIFFHSGGKKIGSSVVDVTQADIFDVVTGVRTTIPLPAGSPGRSYSATAVVGSKVLFAGGMPSTNWIDIYDTLTNTWTTDRLSLDRYYLAGIGIGDRAFFAGGSSASINKVTSAVDVYDANTGSWNVIYPPIITSPIVEGHGGRDIAAAAIGDKVLFAGGSVNDGRTALKIVSIYSLSANEWLPGTVLPHRRTEMSSIVYGNKVYFVGGMARDSVNDKTFPSDTIIIYDNGTDTWSTMQIPRMMNRYRGGQRAYVQSAQAGCKMFLVPYMDGNGGLGNMTPGNGDTIAVYDFARNTWSYLPLPHARTKVTIAAAKNKVYFAGGHSISYVADGGWEWLNHIDILTLEPKLQLAVENIPATQYDFDKVVIDEEKTIAVQLSNEGDYDLLFSATPYRIVVSGDTEDFSIDQRFLDTTDTLRPAQVISLPVVFSPRSIGSKQLTISISSNDPENPIYTYTLTGEGYDAVTSITTSVLNEGSVRLYPNPATDHVRIVSPTNDELYVQIANIQGQVVEGEKLLKDRSIDVSSLPSGLYFFKFRSASFLEVIKVLKN